MSQPIALDYEQSDSNWLPEFLRPPPPGPPISDPQQIRREYAYFRPRILFWSTVGYGTFYFVRKNLSVAMPVMMAQLHLQKTSLGLILTLHGVLYGTSKFLNGMLADRANARLFMALALIICAVMNVFFGLSVSMIFLGTFWMINGWFQGMGYPPCARLLTHWSAPRELASKMAVWNISHSLGGAAIVILCAKLLEHYHHWQICFFVPSAIALVMAGLLLLNLRDTPESVGLPPVESTPMPPIRGWGFCITCMIGVLVLCGGMYFMHRWDWQFCLVVLGISGAMALLILANLRDVPETTPGLHAADAQLQTQSAVPVHPIAADHFRQFLWDKVFSNKYIWLVSMANFTVYTIRFAIFDWGPTLLHEYKGMPLIDAASIVAGFEVAGLFGMLATGWLTDRLFAGRGAPHLPGEHAAVRPVDLPVLEGRRPNDLAQHIPSGRRGFFRLRPAGTGRRDRRPSGHQTGGGNGGGIDVDLRLCQHGAFRMGIGRRWCSTKAGTPRSQV